MDWSCVDCLWIIVMYLSAVWTLILTAPIHCIGSVSKYCNSQYILMKTQTRCVKLIHILDSLRVNTLLAHFHFYVDYFFSCFKWIYTSYLIHFWGMVNVSFRKASPLLWWEQIRNTRWMGTKYWEEKQSGGSSKVSLKTSSAMNC